MELELCVKNEVVQIESKTRHQYWRLHWELLFICTLFMSSFPKEKIHTHQHIIHTYKQGVEGSINTNNNEKPKP